MHSRLIPDPFFQIIWVWFRFTLPETNIFGEKWCLEYTTFLLGFGLFSGANEVFFGGFPTKNVMSSWWSLLLGSGTTQPLSIIYFMLICWSLTSDLQTTSLRKTSCVQPVGSSWESPRFLVEKTWKNHEGKWKPTNIEMATIWYIYIFIIIIFIIIYI